MRKIWTDFIWETKQKDTVYFTFDDGPHSSITPFVLEQLALYNAKASFFCIGKNVAAHPNVFEKIIAQGHTIGNHTYHHINGWKSSIKSYVYNVYRAQQIIPSKLFRPPYGRIRPRQAKYLLKRGYKIVMWSLLTGDFDTHLKPEDCMHQILANIKPGDIIVFHDSEKAWERLSYCLPKILAYCKEKNWKMAALPFQ